MGHQSDVIVVFSYAGIGGILSMSFIAMWLWARTNEQGAKNETDLAVQERRTREACRWTLWLWPLAGVGWALYYSIRSIILLVLHVHRTAYPLDKAKDPGTTRKGPYR